MFTLIGYIKRIDRIHEISLRLILNDYESSFYDMLSTLNEKMIQQCRINVLLTEMYKYLNGLSPKLMNKVIYLHQKHFELTQFKFLCHGISFSTGYRANQLWQTLPSELKDCPSLQLFKNKIKTWRCDTCQCQIGW